MDTGTTETSTSAYLTQAAAAVLIDSERPPSRDTLILWHDRIRGPRDTYGRRIWTHEVCEQVRRARADRKATAA
jgi:hypothetical protein